MFSLTACLAFLENEKDEEAFLRYYERYHRLVLYEAEKIVGPSAAEDVMQNTFVYIAKHFSTFRSGSSKKVTHLAALYARRRALDYLRRDAKQAGHPAGEPPDEDTDSVFADASLDTERLVMTADRLEHAIAVVDSLPEIYRDTLRLKMIGYSDDEICDILDLNKTTVYKRLQRAYRMARERMAKNDETGT